MRVCVVGVCVWCVFACVGVYTLNALCKLFTTRGASQLHFHCGLQLSVKLFCQTQRGDRRRDNSTFAFLCDCGGSGVDARGRAARLGMWAARQAEGCSGGAIFCFEPLRKYDVSSNAQQTRLLPPSWRLRAPRSPTYLVSRGIYFYKLCCCSIHANYT